LGLKQVVDPDADQWRVGIVVIVVVAPIVVIRRELYAAVRTPIHPIVIIAQNASKSIRYRLIASFTFETHNL